MLPGSKGWQGFQGWLTGVGDFSNVSQRGTSVKMSQSTESIGPAHCLKAWARSPDQTSTQHEAGRGVGSSQAKVEEMGKQQGLQMWAAALKPKGKSD